ncbi:putative two-component response regulator CheY [Candidatus Kuenenia stuttgartiensis]|uniref:Putative two-component response regulator CheY n=1 Tax=Kuenenia stuttgartiensis TaxID=174633 RepID=Q1Q318_KUEST|nr:MULTISPECIES: response regulator [Kuenenia]MBZ0193256.1 response regulator [Candidatus Kuenenia stuttgartiensis]MCL4728009.1 response regulator [Candidatus Kuenenia stuttgartiensis]MCZ7622106.1 response regulator [Candidatus Kuenenia sp.]QII11506.1 putative two-component response regulator CheY [Candidatus Kuenenia stuttgartiensis]CAJ74400.1 similar to two-component response regulator CheY [Candidatus Kuenenia stuttgartiensis]
MPSSRIMIVEDERQTVDTLRDLFEQYGYETEVALNKNVAMNILQERKMDVLIISEMVQDIPGIEIMYDIRKTNKFLPIIMICDQKSKRIESSLMKAGANIVLSKPLDPIIAVQTIDNLLKMKYIAENIKPKKRKTSLKKK